MADAGKSVRDASLNVLLAGIYDTNTVSLAPQVLKAYAEQFEYARPVAIDTRK